MPDILLVQPPIHDFYLTAKRTIPYGLASIAAVLKNEGFSVEILDGLATDKSRPLSFPSEMRYLEAFYKEPDVSPFGLFHQYRHFGYSYEHLSKTAAASGARVIGISSLFTPYADEAIVTAEHIRKRLPKAVIVFGGHHPTTLPAAVMDHPVVNFVLRGEGEASMPIFMKTLLSGTGFSRVPGIVFRRPDGELHIGEPAMMPSLDRFPLPDRSLINSRFYRRGKKGATVVVTSRGCPMKCSYCALGNKALYPHRSREVTSVLAEIEEAVSHHDAGFIDFEDENLSFNRHWFLSLLRGISKRFGPNGPELRAMNGLFPPTLDQTVIAAMKSAGFKTLNLSIGSSQPGQLKRFRRPDVRSAFSTALSLAETNDMDAVGYIIIGAPGQTPNDSLEDLLFLAEHRVLAGVSVFYPAPGSADYDTCERIGVLPHRFSLMRSSALPISDTTSRLEVVTLLRLGRIVNFMKHLRDNNIPESFPEGLNGPSNIDARDREFLGIRLLKAFLHDGVIRGVTPEGLIYNHASSKALIQVFLKRLKAISIRGVKR